VELTPKQLYDKQYYQANRKDRIESAKAYHEANKEKRKKQHRAAQLKREYNITPEQYEQMVLIQQGKCAICGVTPDKLHVDHCHIEGHVRSLLCGKCNRGLGLFDDNPHTLLKAAEYVGEHQ